MEVGELSFSEHSASPDSVADVEIPPGLEGDGLVRRGQGVNQPNDKISGFQELLLRKSTPIFEDLQYLGGIQMTFSKISMELVG